MTVIYLNKKVLCVLRDNLVKIVGNRKYTTNFYALINSYVVILHCNFQLSGDFVHLARNSPNLNKCLHVTSIILFGFSSFSFRFIMLSCCCVSE